MGRRLWAWIGVWVGMVGVASAQETLGVAEVHVVHTALRTVLTSPCKGVIEDAETWARVTNGLEGAPEAPDFAAGQVAALLVIDVGGGAAAHLEGVEWTGEGPRTLRVILQQAEPQAGALQRPSVCCAFLFVEAFQGGVRLDLRSVLGEGGGFIQRTIPAGPEDHDPEALPELGPDLRLEVVMADGGPPPPGLVLRVESHFLRRDLPPRTFDQEVPAEGLRYPRFRDQVRYTLTVFAPGLRARNPLRLDRLPTEGPDGNPRRIQHRFVVERTR